MGRILDGGDGASLRGGHGAGEGSGHACARAAGGVPALSAGPGVSLAAAEHVARLRLDRGTWGLIGARGAFHTLGVALWFYAMARIPIADVTAMNYLSPIYVTLGAALFLGETLAARRILAVVMALCGALIILRPGFREVGAGHLAMLFTAIFFGGSYLLAKMISARVSAGVVVAMLSITVTVGLAPMAWAVWVMPTWWELGVLFGVACLATGGITR